MTINPLIEKYWTISIKFKIRISQPIAKIVLKQQSLNQITLCLTEHVQNWHHFFDQKFIFNTFSVNLFSSIALVIFSIPIPQFRCFFPFNFSL